MRFSQRLLFTSIVSILCSIYSFSTAQETNTEHTLRLSDGFIPKPTSIDDLAWLQGYWVGEGLGGDCEEMWSAPMGGAMLGTFRMLQKGELAFSEFFVLAEENGEISLKLKHFNPDFDGWEEKDKFIEFKFIKTEGRTAWFNGLTYRLVDDNTLKVFVAMKKKDGTFDEGSFTFKRENQTSK